MSKKVKDNKNWHNYAKSHNLFNRVIDMLEFFEFFDKTEDVKYAKRKVKDKMQSLYFVESLCYFFEKRLKQNMKNEEIRCNLYDLISDLNYLKQYLKN